MLAFFHLSYFACASTNIVYEPN